MLIQDEPKVKLGYTYEETEDPVDRFLKDDWYHNRDGHYDGYVS